MKDPYTLFPLEVENKKKRKLQKLGRFGKYLIKDR